MSIALALIGAALLTITYIDIFKTALTIQGGGPVTSPMTTGFWRVLITLHRLWRSDLLLVYGGPAIALCVVLLWMLLQWAAWSLIFSGSATAVLVSQTDTPADAWGRIYYAGYTLSTLGLGDYRPEGALWLVLTDICAGSGFLSISLAATYLIPLVSAAAAKRDLAIYIYGLGGSPTDILVAGWNGKDFSALTQHLTALVPMIIQVSEQHLIYPVLYYFHSTSDQDALSVRMSALNEALLLADCGVQPDLRLARATIGPVMQGIETYFSCLQRAHIAPADAAPPPPSLEPLRTAGIPVVNGAEYERAMARYDLRRRLALSLVEDAGWAWDEVILTDAADAPPGGSISQRF